MRISARAEIPARSEIPTRSAQAGLGFSARFTRLKYPCNTELKHSIIFDHMQKLLFLSANILFTITIRVNIETGCSYYSVNEIRRKKRSGVCLWGQERRWVDSNS